MQIPAPRYKIGKGLLASNVKHILVEAQRTRLYALAATLGFRSGELLDLRGSDLDLNLDTVAQAKTIQRVNGQLVMDDTKTDDLDNTIPLPKITRRVLNEHRDWQATERADASELWNEHDLVFATAVGTPIEPRNLNRTSRAVHLRVGYPTVRLHGFRHTVVGLLIQVKTPPHVVQRIARHSGLDVILGIHAHIDLDAMREVLDKTEWEDM